MGSEIVGADPVEGAVKEMVRGTVTHVFEHHVTIEFGQFRFQIPRSELLRQNGSLCVRPNVRIEAVLPPAQSPPPPEVVFLPRQVITRIERGE